MNAVKHLLVCLNEECVEVAKDADKAIRFGLDDVNVLEPNGPTNRERLINELNDLFAVAELLMIEGILPPGWMSAAKQRDKRVKVRKFMAYARSVGELDK